MEIKNMEFGKFQLLPHNYNENDNCYRLQVENVNRGLDHWLTLRNRKGEIIGHLKLWQPLPMQRPHVFEVTDIRQAGGPILWPQD